MRTAPLFAALAGACTPTVPVVPDPTDSAIPDPIATADTSATTTPPPSRDVDLLIVMDDSSGMLEENAALVAELPRLLRTLISGDLDGDGDADTTPVESLHVGVVTGDMGTGAHVVPTCSSSDDGRLQSSGSALRAGCGDTFPRFQALDAPSALEVAGLELACVVSGVGQGGCGFQQPLEAAWRALAPSPEGRADDHNAGFLREHALLALLIVSDGDDCSAADPALFDPASKAFAGALGLRCIDHPEAQHPLARYVAGLRSVRPADRLLVTVVGGVPADVVDAPYEQILADARMEQVVDPNTGDRPLASCAAELGPATPPRRLVQLLADLRDEGAHTALGTVCDGGSLEEAITALATRIGSALPEP